MPEQITITRHGTHCFTISVTWGLMNVDTHSTQDWKNFLRRRGWLSVPRVWGA